MSGFLKGTGVALATPFDKDGSIDFEGLTSLVNYCVSGNVEYLVVLGTTAESVTLSKEEKKKIVAHIVKVNAKRLPLVIGIGGNNTATILQEIKETGYLSIIGCCGRRRWGDKCYRARFS